MKNFILDSNPNFGEAKCSMKDDNGKKTDYRLVSVKGNGLFLSVEENGVQKDCISFSRQDLKAMFMLLCTEKK